MEHPNLSSEAANPQSLSAHEVLILHTADAHEWAAYLQNILKSTRKFHKRSILLYAVGPDDQLHGYNFECFQSCKCIVLLLTGTLLDMLCERDLQEALQRLLQPPNRVVPLLCGVSEEDVFTDIFTDWSSWRKLSAEDDPSVYTSTILDSITDFDNRHAVTEHTSEAAAEEQLHNAVSFSAEDPTTDKKEEAPIGRQEEVVPRDEETESSRNSESVETNDASCFTCVTVQPNRVQCGEGQKIFIIFKHKIDAQSAVEVEFSSKDVAVKRVSPTVENEYTLSVTAPDMPAGEVALSMVTDQSPVSLMPVTYYTCMGEVSRYLEVIADPVNFICQAFNLTSNSRESLDSMLTDSFKSRMPANGLQLFGIKQIEEDNMASYQRNEELPTLLHFAAKYGLKKLTTILLQCPGVLQAYSVMNKHGDYPNTLAEKSGFSDLRQFIDEFAETADMLKSHMEESINTEESTDVYEMMSNTSQDIMMKYSGVPEDIYESMLGIDPECAEDLYEVMSAVSENPEEAMLRKFFQAKPHASVNQDASESLQKEEEGEAIYNDLDLMEEEEDPYKLFPEDIYDSVDVNSTYNQAVLNRPPAPIPRPETEPEKPIITRVFSESSMTTETASSAARPVAEPLSPVYDPYAGMKTPGQRQLISLQERVKVGEITVEEAVQEFKSWQFDHERRANSIRYQQENLKRLRDSITRRHKEKQKTGNRDLDYEISAPLERSWGSGVTLECAVYEPIPRALAGPAPPVPQVIQRGNWKTGSTSSTSSTESNRLSTHSTFSYSSGTEPEIEDTPENLPPPPRPPRPSDGGVLPPPRIPPRIPGRVSEKMLNERYISCPTRALPQRPSQRHTDIAPPIPRRLR
ncbi:uncharacterized protein V6R79_016263 [Siganus canaliculatus]